MFQSIFDSGLTSDRVIQPSDAVKARHKSQGHQVQGGDFTDTEMILLLNLSKIFVSFL